MRIKTIFLLLLAALPLSAADTFVTFAEQSGAVALRSATLTYADSEPQAVKIATASLVNDFQSVMGYRPTTGEKGTILIGTVGFNKQIDQWVKSGKLANLKGKREKFIITTIDGQVVIAGSGNCNLINTGIGKCVFCMVFRYGVVEYYTSCFSVSDYERITAERNSFICCCGI